MLEVVLTGCTLMMVLRACMAKFISVTAVENTMSAAGIVAERCWPGITGEVWFGYTVHSLLAV